MTDKFRRERKFALWFIILIGFFIRVLPALQTDFPLNDGGMFLVMIRDLRANHFVLPQVTRYNLADIPFAYSPFSFYVAAFISSLLPVSDLDLIRWIPAIVSAAIIPVFYWLTLRVFRDSVKALIAAAILSVLPGSFEWLVMGGGLSRSFGILFFLFAAGHTLQLFRDKTRSSLLPAILFSSLAVLSHPEVGLQTAGLCFLLWALYERNRKGIQYAFFLAAGVAACTALWWLAVLTQHGVDPFLSAAQTGIRETLAASLFHSFFSTQGSIPILPFLSLLGLFVTIRKREFLLVGWAFLPFFLDPRNAPAIAQYAFILLSSEGLYFLRGEFVKRYSAESANDRQSLIRVASMINVVFALLLAYLLYASWLSVRTLARLSLQQADREAMEWVRVNTPQDAQFLLLTNAGQISPMVDSYQEWFPALTQRHSVNTLQGKEWTLGPRFYPYSLELVVLQQCADIDCLQAWAVKNNAQFDFLAVQSRRISPQLLNAIESDDRYQTVYTSDSTIIFQRK